MSSLLPLAGVRVIDFSRVLAGPLIGQLLGDLGAEVIKIERPGTGDDTRTWGPPWHQDDPTGDGQATYYLSLNRNKRSIVLDLKDPEDVVVARRLALSGDIVLDNFKPGFLASLGLDHDHLANEKPSLISATITAFGSQSAAADLPGYDLVAQAMGGLMHLTGEEEGRPLRVGVPIVDMMTGYNATVGVLAALADRNRTGRGRHIEVSLYDSALAALGNHQTGVLMGGAQPARAGNRHPSIAPYESYRCSDGDIIVAAANDKLFARLCQAIDRTDLLDDPRFGTNTDRRAHVEALNETINAALARDTRAAWIDRIRAAEVPCGPINSLAEAIAWAEEMQIEPLVTGADGFVSIRSPIQIDGEVLSTSRRPPRLGEHGEEIRAELNGPSASPAD